MSYFIGRVAKMLNVSPQALRNWENQHLISKPQRRPTGHREYTDEDVRSIEQFLDRRKQKTNT